MVNQLLQEVTLFTDPRDLVYENFHNCVLLFRMVIRVQTVVNLHCGSIFGKPSDPAFDYLSSLPEHPRKVVFCLPPSPS